MTTTHNGERFSDLRLESQAGAAIEDRLRLRIEIQETRSEECVSVVTAANSEKSCEPRALASFVHGFGFCVHRDWNFRLSTGSAILNNAIMPINVGSILLYLTKYDDLPVYYYSGAKNQEEAKAKK